MPITPTAPSPQLTPPTPGSSSPEPSTSPGARSARGLARVLRGRFALLFLFLLASIVVYPYAERSGVGFYAFRIVGALVVLLTVYAVTYSRGMLLGLVVIFAVPSILHHVVLPSHATGVLPLISRILSFFFDLLVLGLIFRHVFTTERPDSETIFGALCIYLLLGFSFASCYQVIDLYRPGAFLLSPSLHTAPNRFDFIYYSIGTLTESGSPGIMAVYPLARSLSSLEAITGILYLAVLISRLLSAYRPGERAAAERDR